MPVSERPSPYEIAAEGLKAIIDEEFAAEQIVAIHDKLHESLGRRRVAVGISPQREVPLPRNEAVQQTYIMVQFYDLWTEEIDPETSVNPFKIARYADRFRRAVRSATASEAGSSEVWYYRVIGVEYPDDPTGNRSRFVATVLAYGENAALVETS